MAQAFDEKIEEQEQLLELIASHVADHTKRLDKIDAKLIEHDRRFNQIDERFDRVEERLNNHDKRFDQIIGIVQDIRKENATTHASLERIERHLEP